MLLLAMMTMMTMMTIEADEPMLVNLAVRARTIAGFGEPDYTFPFELPLTATLPALAPPQPVNGRGCA